MKHLWNGVEISERQYAQLQREVESLFQVAKRTQLIINELKRRITLAPLIAGKVVAYVRLHGLDTSIDDLEAIVTKSVSNLLMPVECLELSVRVANCLTNAKIEIIWDLVQYTEAEMLKNKNFGRKSLKELKEILMEMGLSFQVSDPSGGMIHAKANDLSYNRLLQICRYPLPLSAYKALDGAGIDTLGSLADHTETEMLKIKYIGRATLRDLKKLLKAAGLSFKAEENEIKRTTTS